MLTPLLALERPLSRLLQHLLPLGGRGGLPALAQLALPLGRETFEFPEILAHGALAVGREGPELLPSLPQLLALGRRERLPVLETLAGRRPLCRRHVEPTAAPIRKGLLALRGQAVPVPGEARKEPLLIGRQ